MPIFMDFSLKPTEMTCWYDGELDQPQWDLIQEAIKDKSLRLGFCHRPTLISLEVPLSSIYEGSADIKVKSNGVVIVSAAGKAKIDGSAKAIKEIESDHPTNMAFDSIKALTDDGRFGAMSIIDNIDDVDATIKISAKKL